MTRHHSEYKSSFQPLKWLGPNNGGSILTRCRRSSFLLTYTGPNEFKLTLNTQETSLYEVIVAVLLEVSLKVCSRAPNLAVRWAIIREFGNFGGFSSSFLLDLFTYLPIYCLFVQDKIRSWHQWNRMVVLYTLWSLDRFFYCTWTQN